MRRQWLSDWPPLDLYVVTCNTRLCYVRSFTPLSRCVGVKVVHRSTVSHWQAFGSARSSVFGMRRMHLFCVGFILIFSLIEFDIYLRLWLAHCSGISDVRVVCDPSCCSRVSAVETRLPAAADEHISVPSSTTQFGP